MPRHFLVVAALLVAPAGCSSDPGHAHLVDSLGGEAPGVPKGPLHRPGQPCGVCHGTLGPANSEFVFAGTIYQDPMSGKPLPDARIQLVDSKGTSFDAGANCAGNFFVRNTDYRPAFPVWVNVFYGLAGGMPYPATMTSGIYREASCASCHTDNAGTESAGPVFLASSPIPIPPSPSCQ